MRSDDSQGSDDRRPEEERAEVLFAEFLGQLEGGEVDFESFCDKHLDLATEVRALHDHWQKVRSVLDRLSPANTLAESIRSRYGSAADPGVSLEKEEDAEADFSSEIIGRLAGRTGAFGRYKLKGEVARGGMGAILRVWDEDLRRNLAMKVILGKGEATSGDTPDVDTRTLGRFLEEAQITGQLDHPGIVPVHELGLDHQGQVYFTMKLVKGRDLKHIFDLVHQEEEGWTLTRALGVLLKVCEAMAYAHDKSVVHRDLKPANIMVGKYGEVYVMDWGLARVEGREDSRDLRPDPATITSLSEVRTDRKESRKSDSDSPVVTMDGTVVGTPAYMPPEQARGELERLGPRSDVYALGAMLYQLLTGEVPFVPSGVKVSPRTILMRVLEGPPKLVRELAPDRVPAELEAICEKAMERDPKDRYPDVGALAADLRAFLEGRVVAAYRTGAVAEFKKWVGRNKAVASWASAAIIFLLAGIGTGVFFLSELRLKDWREWYGNRRWILAGDAVGIDYRYTGSRQFFEIVLVNWTHERRTEVVLFSEAIDPTLNTGSSHSRPNPPDVSFVMGIQKLPTDGPLSRFDRGDGEKNALVKIAWTWLGENDEWMTSSKLANIAFLDRGLVRHSLYTVPEGQGAILVASESEPLVLWWKATYMNSRGPALKSPPSEGHVSSLIMLRLTPD